MTNEQVRAKAEAIQRVQTRGWVHPLTCGRNSQHVLAPIVWSDEDGKDHIDLTCPVCGWMQRWFPLHDYESLANYNPLGYRPPV